MCAMKVKLLQLCKCAKLVMSTYIMNSVTESALSLYLHFARRDYCHFVIQQQDKSDLVEL